jgi:hypothetical protein
MEKWIEARIFVNEGKQTEVLLSFIKPLVQQLRSTYGILAYHFLHEPDNEIRFRVLTTPDKVDSIKGLIENFRHLPQVRELKYPEVPYNGEKEAFGEDGWKTTYKFLEAGSDFALDRMDSSVKKGPQFNWIAFSHYFLNQSGLNQISEANFHATASIERIVTWVLTQFDIREKNIKQQISQLETRIQELEKAQEALEEKKKEKQKET